jgi:hypothetical protein
MATPWVLNEVVDGRSTPLAPKPKQIRWTMYGAVYGRSVDVILTDLGDDAGPCWEWRVVGTCDHVLKFGFKREKHQAEGAALDAAWGLGYRH